MLLEEREVLASRSKNLFLSSSFDHELDSLGFSSQISLQLEDL